MRNLRQYPLTKKELLDCLETMKTEILEEEGIGDMRPFILQKAIEIVTDSSFEIDEGHC